MLVFTFGSCSRKTAPDNKPVFEEQVKGNVKEGYQKATVIDMRELDGCQYMLKLESGDKLNPINLPDSVKQNNLEILVKFIPSDIPTICMSGKTVKIIAIENLK